ncbi:hypothetical protein ACFSUK_14665 [Sphingobium scionense]|uniref:Uncharacterized protein n=1 Tax=Sphingobium scionense TaxID=1404341 RepID=A0A7W6PXK9_9SPHN|nr:hypothetical protein [Sphingobium scionense]MBB4149352.1 hypothetical protein [Sphingobium scionense]
MTKRPALLLLLALGACHASEDDGVGSVTAAEASALNAAAAQLDARAGAASPPEAGLNPAAVAAARADRRQTTGNAAR